MSKQLFEAVADTIAAIDNRDKQNLQASWWIEYFTKRYPQFDHDRFLDYLHKARLWYIDHAEQFREKVGFYTVSP